MKKLNKIPKIKINYLTILKHYKNIGIILQMIMMKQQVLILQLNHIQQH